MKRFAKKLLSVLVVVVLFCSIIPLTGSAAEIDITTKFTDANFLAKVYKLVGKTAPTPIYDTDVANITKLNVSAASNTSLQIRSLDGLEYFVNLKELDCSANLLTSLPELPSGLTTLECRGCQLTSLPELPSGLTALSCYDNKLTSLPELPSGLKTLNCRANELTSLPELPLGLTQLYCYYNFLTSIDITGLNLITLNITFNKLADESCIIGLTENNKPTYYNFSPQSFYTQENVDLLSNLIVEAKTVNKKMFTLSIDWSNLQSSIQNAENTLNSKYLSDAQLIRSHERLQEDMDSVNNSSAYRFFYSIFQILFFWWMY